MKLKVFYFSFNFFHIVQKEIKFQYMPNLDVNFSNLKISFTTLINALSH